MTQCRASQNFLRTNCVPLVFASVAAASCVFAFAASPVSTFEAQAAGSDTIVRVGSPDGRYVDGPKLKAVANPAAEAKVKKAAVKQAPLKPGDIAVSEIMKPGPLPELTLGNKDAAVTIVEYADLTCGHCATFHNTVFPELKKKYIDTGKVFFIMREFPLNNLSAAASLLGRCAGGDKTFPFISVLFKKQREWTAGQGSAIPPLFELAKQAGFTRERFDKCLKDDKLLAKILENRKRASSAFKVTSTPTFFINGRRLKGGSDISEFSDIIDPMLGEG